jgi:hypothetical protein
MSEERKLILEMLSQGKITVAEAEKLMEAQGNDVNQGEAVMVKSANKKFLKVLVNEGDKTKVNINIPIALAEVGLKLIPKEHLKVEGKEIDLHGILNLIKEGNEGDLVNIETSDHGKDVKVKIFIE